MSALLFESAPSPDDNPFMVKFNLFWAKAIFRKLGKQEAIRHLRTTVKTEKDWQDLEKAHEAYRDDVVAHPRDLLHGSTFCNTWRDYLDLGTVKDQPNPQVLKQQAKVREMLKRPDKPDDWDPNYAREVIAQLRGKIKAGANSL